MQSNCIREDNPDHIILLVGTNELSSENDAERVGKSIVDLAKSLLSENRKVTISGSNGMIKPNKLTTI